MADKHSSSPRSDNKKSAPSRRNDVIRCENCGEDYAITYKRCPFCDERPGRAGGYGPNGRRMANTRGGGYGAPMNPLQVAMLVISLIIIVVAAVIVIRFVGIPALNGGNSSSSTSQDSTSQSSGSQSTPNQGGSSSSSQSNTGAASSASGSQDQSASGAGEVESITMSRDQFTLRYDEVYQLSVVVTPKGLDEKVVWTSSDPKILTVDEEGKATNINAGTTQERVTVTATVGDRVAECVVFCRPKNPNGDSSASNGTSGSTGTSGGTGSSGTSGTGSSTGNTGASGNTGSSGGTSGGTVVKGTPATIVNADGGLNIRSGPGRENEVVASAANGAKVTILGEEKGWYKIAYDNTSTGYVAKEFVSPDQ